MGKRKQHRARPNRYLTEDERNNELMRHYYQGQFGWTDEQWDSFYTVMRTELPATFRVTGFREQSREVHWLIRNEFLERLSADARGRSPSERLATPFSWYPGELAYQLGASKLEIRKNPNLKRLHRFLVSETESGFISRQEAVSMLPPLLLDVESHHRVLDLCAAPGSKTAQLVEMLHAAMPVNESARGQLPSGLVVANDVDSKRCYMMVHQLQRLQSPCVVVVRQDASIFPRLYLAPADDETDIGAEPITTATANNNAHTSGTKPTLLTFDRILADVPCSGDGTLRKNQDLWPRWSPFLGVNEHFLQLKILRRALEMLAEGGRVVYSTCSLNPIEDEAVVAAVLSQCGGAARLLDIEHKLNGLQTDPGLTRWRVMLKDRSWCSSLEDVPTEKRRSLRASLFPPANISDLHIERCRRVMPYHQNTGGFFLALIEKVSCLPWMKQTAREGASQLTQSNTDTTEPIGSQTVEVKIEPIGSQNDEVKTEPIGTETVEVKTEPIGTETVEVKTEPIGTETVKVKTEPIGSEAVKVKTELIGSENVRETAPVSRTGPPAAKRARIFREDPFLYLGDGDDLGAVWEPVRDYYGISADFPARQLLYRNADGRRRNYYFTNSLVRRLVRACNQSQRVDQSGMGAVNLVNLGVKLLALSDERAFTGYRVLQDGIDLLAPFLGSARRLRLGCRDDLVRLLAFDMPLAREFSPELQAGFSALPVGPVLFEYVPSDVRSDASVVEGDSGHDNSESVNLPRIPLLFAGWRGRSSVRHYVGVHERSHLQRLCGLDPVEVLPAARAHPLHDPAMVRAALNVDSDSDCVATSGGGHDNSDSAEDVDKHEH